MLRIDYYTASGTRGSFARLCIQVDLDKPLINMVKIGRLKQRVTYEGIGSLCYCCGRLGHRQENCCYQVKTPETTTVGEEACTSMPKKNQVEEKIEANYGAWMLVTRRKNLVRNGRNIGPNQKAQQEEKFEKTSTMHFGTEVGPKNQGKDQNSSREHQVEDELCVGHTDKIVEGESNTLPKSVGNIKAGLNTELASSSSGLEGIDMTKQHRRKGKEKKASGTKAPNILKRLNPSSSSKPTPYQRVAKKYSTPENEANNPRSSSSPPSGLGNMVQESVSTCLRRNDSPNQSFTHHNDGQSRGGALCSMETSLSNHPDQNHNGESSTGPPSTGGNPQSMVAIHYRCTTDNRGSSNKFEQAKKAISSASLGRIRMDCVGEESHRFQGSSRLAYGELPNFETVPNPHSIQEV